MIILTKENPALIQSSSQSITPLFTNSIYRCKKNHQRGRKNRKQYQCARELELCCRIITAYDKDKEMKRIVVSNKILGG